MAKVTLIGSCVTRDLWRTRSLPATGLTFIARTSLASLFSPPVPDRPLPDGVGGPDGFDRRMVMADIVKSHPALLREEVPDTLLLDFIDERFDLLRIGDAAMTVSLGFTLSGLAERAPYARGVLVDRLSAEADALWWRGLEALRALLDAPRFARTRLVLHCARAVTHQLRDGAIHPLDEAFAVPPGRMVRIRDLNALLDSCHRRFLELFPEAVALRVPEEHHLACPDHVWGLSPFHWIPSYHRELHRLALENGLELA